MTLFKKTMFDLAGSMGTPINDPRDSVRLREDELRQRRLKSRRDHEAQQRAEEFRGQSLALDKAKLSGAQQRYSAAREQSERRYQDTLAEKSRSAAQRRREHEDQESRLRRRDADNREFRKSSVERADAKAKAQQEEARSKADSAAALQHRSNAYNNRDWQGGPEDAGPMTGAQGGYDQSLDFGGYVKEQSDAFQARKLKEYNDAISRKTKEATLESKLLALEAKRNPKPVKGKAPASKFTQSARKDLLKRLKGAREGTRNPAERRERLREIMADEVGMSEGDVGLRREWLEQIFDIHPELFEVDQRQTDPWWGEPEKLPLNAGELGERAKLQSLREQMLGGRKRSLAELQKFGTELGSEYDREGMRRRIGLGPGSGATNSMLPFLAPQLLEQAGLGPAEAHARMNAAVSPDERALWESEASAGDMPVEEPEPYPYALEQALRGEGSMTPMGAEREYGNLALNQHLGMAPGSSLDAGGIPAQEAAPLGWTSSGESEASGTSLDTLLNMVAEGLTGAGDAVQEGKDAIGRGVHDVGLDLRKTLSNAADSYTQLDMPLGPHDPFSRTAMNLGANAYEAGGLGAAGAAGRAIAAVLTAPFASGSLVDQDAAARANAGGPRPVPDFSAPFVDREAEARANAGGPRAVPDFMAPFVDREAQGRVEAHRDEIVELLRTQDARERDKKAAQRRDNAQGRSKRRKAKAEAKKAAEAKAKKEKARNDASTARRSKKKTAGAKRRRELEEKRRKRRAEAKERAREKARLKAKGAKGRKRTYEEEEAR